MNTISSVNFSGKKVLVRVDFNVPLDESMQITDDNRIRASLPTIKKIVKDGGKVILMSHLGRPKSGPTDKYSLKHLVKHLSKVLETEVQFANDCIGEDAKRKADELKPGQILLLENLRFYKEEENGDPGFAKKLAALGDIYVNDAFGTAHRAHASTAVIAHEFPGTQKMFGLLMEAEIKNAEKVLNSSEKPFTAILGGAKVSDKILLIENLLGKANHIIIGGGMAYTFFKAQHAKVGRSLVEDERLKIAMELIEKAKQQNVKIHLPEDSVIADDFSNDASTKISDNTNISDGWMGLDIGPKAIQAFRKVIDASCTILWNGPMGVFEMPKFQEGTKAIAEAVAAATDKGAFSLVGGGDSVAAVNQFGFADKVSYVSTGGGALLEYFEGKELPGITAVKY